jgi:RHS repeat-associated protein
VHRFTGAWDKQYDTTNSLVLMGARPYDPNLGRFLAVDPIDGGSLNNYDYAGQDPVNGYDLGGTMSTDGNNLNRGGLWEDLSEAEKIDAKIAEQDERESIEEGTTKVTYDTGHATRGGTRTGGVPSGSVQEAIEKDIERNIGKLETPGDGFRGKVTVNGVTFEYRAFRVSDARIHVGTYFPAK